MTTASLRHSTRPPLCTIYCNSSRACWAGTSPLHSVVALSLSLSFANLRAHPPRHAHHRARERGRTTRCRGSALGTTPQTVAQRSSTAESPSFSAPQHHLARASALCTYYCVCAVRSDLGEACVSTRPPHRPPCLPCPHCSPLTTASRPLQSTVLADVSCSVFLVEHGFLCRSWRAQWPQVTARRADVRFPHEPSSYRRNPVGTLLCHRCAGPAAPPIHHEQHAHPKHTSVSNWTAAKAGSGVVRLHHYHSGT